MKFESLSHVPDDVLESNLKALVAEHRANRAAKVAFLIEIKKRGLLAQLVPEPVDPSNESAEPTPPGWYSLRGTLAQETYELLRYASALLGSSEVFPWDDEAVVEFALNALIEKLESEAAR